MSQVNVLLEEKVEKVLVVSRPAPSVGCVTGIPAPVALDATIPPILAPPVEIMSRIIDFGAQDDIQGFPVLFSHICRDLRYLALSTPKLWSSIDFVGGSSSHQELIMRLGRTQDAPIDITISNLETVEDAEAILKYLVPHVSRWRSFHLKVLKPEVAELVMKSLVEEAPALESMSLNGTAESPFSPFGGRARSLKHLFVKHMPLVWDTTMFHNVRTLHIESPSWTSTRLLASWQALENLTIRADNLHPLIFTFDDTQITLPHLRRLELNGITEDDIVRILSHVELPALTRMLFTHIRESPEQIVNSIIPLPNLRQLRLHATEMCQENLLNVLRKVRNLKIISFEDSSPIPTFIHELTPQRDFDSWIIPNVVDFKVTAFEKDNAHRVYDDTDIAEALRQMMCLRQTLRRMEIRMCVFEGDRDNETRHAAKWDEERAYKSVKLINLDSIEGVKV